MLQLVDKVDHVVAHGRPADPVHVPAVLEAGVLGFDLFHHLFAERAHLGGAGNHHVVVAFVAAGRTSLGVRFEIGIFRAVGYSLTTDTVEGAGVARNVGIQVGPELDQEERVAGALLVQLLEAAGLLREFVVDLLHLDRLQQWVGWLVAYMYKQVLVVLRKWERGNFVRNSVANLKPVQKLTDSSTRSSR